MNIKWNFLMVLALLAMLIGGNASAAQEQQGGITSISPQEGTVGTQVTVTGTGFGDKHGEILLGLEKCKVLAWSDTEITFLVDKPQHPDAYPITVLLQGDKQPAEPMLFESFTFRRPRVTSGALLLDGALATIVGEYFGDQKGALRVGYSIGENGADLVVEDPRILDWSMNTIRFELPAGVTGQFILAVNNGVGTGLVMMHLDGSMLGQVAPIPDWGGMEDAWENANGVYYKGKFYVFSINYNPGYDDNYRIKGRTFDPNTGQFSSLYVPKGETQVPVQPLVVGDTLWVFHSGHRWAENICCDEIWYAEYSYFEDSGSGAWHTAGWTSVPNVGIYEGATVAPVYDPVNHRISVYYAHDGKLRWFYSDDYGAHWTDDAMVSGDIGGVPIKHDFISATYWPSATTTALIASTGQVIAVNNGQFRGSIGQLTDDFWRPSLVDLGGETGLIYQNHASGADYNTPKMSKLDYGNWSWTGATQLVYLPDTGIPGSSYSYAFSPRGAVNKVATSSGYVRHLYIFYGVHLAEVYTQESIERWYMHDEIVLGPEMPMPAINATVFTQVTAGEEHACAIKANGSVICWGNPNDGRLNAPAGIFSQISAGNWTTCGVKSDHSIACWGKNDYSLVSNRPTGNNFTQVSVGLMVACGLKSDKSVVCWGDSGDGRLTSQTDMTQISAGQWHTCGIKSTGFISCWGDDGGSGRKNPPALPTGTTWKQVSAAAWHTCGIRSDGVAICWGDNDAKRVSPVPTLAVGLTYKEVSAGDWHTCALVSDGSIRCWGSNDDNRASAMPTTGIFTHIEAGIRNTCAVRSDGAILCWGRNSERQSLPPF